MKKTFWKDRWENEEIGFHQTEFSPYLIKYWDRLSCQPGSTVFVPMAGKTSDIIWLMQHGFSVVAIELSQLAVEAFFEENGLSYEKEEQGCFSLYKSDNICFYCGDFFQLEKSDVSQISAVYDRASLIALPPAMREKYVEHMKHMLPVQVSTLLITMEYNQEQMDGPPFSVSQNEVATYYQSKFDISQLDSVDILSENQQFQARGLTALTENTYLLKRK